MLLVPQKEKLIMMVAGSLGKKKVEHGPSVQKLGDESSDPGFGPPIEEVEADPEEGLVAAAEVFSASLNSGDPRAVATALRQFLDVYGACPPPKEDDDDGDY